MNNDVITVQSDGLTLVAEAFGQGPPIVFAHGLTGVRQGVKRQFAALADRYRIVCFDQRGHGESSRVLDPALYDVGRMAGDMAAVMDAFGIRRSIVGGESMGAATTLEFALRHPDRVETLLLTAPALGDTPNTEAARFKELGTVIRQIGMPTFLEAARETWRTVNGWPPEVIDVVGSTFAAHDAHSLGTALQAVMDWVPFKDMNALRRLTCPVCVIGWDGDALHPLALAERVVSIFPNAALEVMPGLPEVFLRPQTVGAIYARFLEGAR